jgi:transposase
MSSIDLCAQRTELPDALLASPFSSLVREIVSILLTQFILQYLPGRADWNLIDEQDAVGHLPLRNSVLQEIPNRVGGDIGLLGAHHEQERATIHFNFEGRRNVSGSVSVDRQSLQVDRTQPLFPMRPGQVERRTHDYKRHGTTSLFAALDVKAGTIVGKCMARHRASEFRKFLDEIERNVPANLDVHIIMDNYATHKTKPIRNWFAKRPCWNVHFTPTSASWINQVERFFALLTERALKRGVFRSVAELEKAIEAYIEATNADPKPFRWTKTADDILASIQRFCLRTLAANA